MADVIEREDVSVETRRNRSRREPSTSDRPNVSDERNLDDDRIIGGLKQQVDEDDWLI